MREREREHAREREREKKENAKERKRKRKRKRKKKKEREKENEKERAEKKENDEKDESTNGANKVKNKDFFYLLLTKNVERFQSVAPIPTLTVCQPFPDNIQNECTFSCVVGTESQAVHRRQAREGEPIFFILSHTHPNGRTGIGVSMNHTRTVTIDHPPSLSSPRTHKRMMSSCRERRRRRRRRRRRGSEETAIPSHCRATAPLISSSC